MRTIRDLTFDDKNANRGTNRGRQLVGHSIKKYGAGRSVLADRRGKLIAGNKTVEQAIAAGLKIRVVPTRGNELVVVQRTDLDMDRDHAARELAIADNRTGELGLEWDAGVLEQLQRDGLELEAWFDEKEFAEIIAGSQPAEPIDAVAQIDRAGELRKTWSTAIGQLWQIGRHRLLIGDATNKGDVDRLCGRNKPQLMITDPPYGVEYDPAWRNRILNPANRRIGKIKNDGRFDWSAAYELFAGDVAYIWHDPRRATQIQTSVEAAGFSIRSQIIWAKSNFVISRAHYHPRHEACWYACRDKCKSAHWIGDHSQTTLWQITIDENIAGGHSTQKPFECMARPIRNHLGDVYDPFVGSGTTIVAAENLHRRCYAMEIDPAFAAVTLERMRTAFPQIKIRRA